ncbi:MAG: type ii site-specific deoxyribonuclease [candidate division WS6 bacterium GW2011_GWC1_33_20]|uniref:site-specific DNA-methyltransferase (adenine-specific) n=1 Tax=candidate division WS6 bacterium GW2011_GWC1_33_20 TaxID=1619089 RepID=A0A0F9ZI04_9BACT|nr:MAG: type ii site-specific deoxyribonuclease [candidate division WS6 bacterium GW2011_GWC1_33_20]
MDIVTKETFKIKLQKLVDHFSDNEQYYKSSKYKEDELRQEFINPLFKALGWDMDNEQGFAPQYREVIHEDRIEIEGKPKAPDYAFKVGSDRKFFVEAKASSVRVFSEIDPAFQLRRYAWSGQLPVSILTDFEEFSVYDTTLEPKHTDKSSVARIKYIDYKDYIKEADYLWDTFSKEAVWKGSFDKFAKREKKGSQLVDKSFLKEIELWRDLVAKDIASNNKLNIYELNFVVQKFIDRIIFLRIAEDRGVESYETLRSAVKSPDTYSQLLKIFSRADEKYNSSLFDLKKDELSTKIKISDKTLDRILNNLYYPKSPYEFSVIGVDILGSVYEQFLGKVIRLTKGGNAVIEEKPEVKKAGGVYYTPQYIVDYIVKNTVGELVEGKTPKDVTKLKIVDPACGSGSFLIGAYNYLLNWHHKYYVENDVEKNLKAKKLFKDGEGNYFLSTQEKKDILLNNIHGVDIDPQAVEVTKLSLALKMLEGENSETINAQYKLFADRILPDLSSNIKCGNSLIGNDYYSDKQISLLGDEELRKVNGFDWDKEFPLVFRYGGFDVVIGNPPYIRIQELQESSPETINYIKARYSCSKSGNIDLYLTFLEKGYNLLSKKGLLGFINPHKFFTAEMGQDLRSFLTTNKAINTIINFGTNQVFENATTYTAVIILQKEKNEVFKYYEYGNGEDYFNLEKIDFLKINISDLSFGMWQFHNRNEKQFIELLSRNSVKLGEICTNIFKGSSTGNDKIYVFERVSSIDDKHLMVRNLQGESVKMETSLLKPLLKAEDVRRFSLRKKSLLVLYPYSLNGNILDKKTIMANYPMVWKYLEENKKNLQKRKIKMKDDDYYKYSAARSLGKYEEVKILIPDILVSSRFAFDSKGEYYHGPSIHSLLLRKDSGISYRALLGILNSSVFWRYIQITGTALRGDAYRLTPMYIENFPIKIEGNEDILLKIEEVVVELEKLYEDESFNKKRIEILEEKLNSFVNSMYGLNDEMSYWLKQEK